MKTFHFFSISILLLSASFGMSSPVYSEEKLVGTTIVSVGEISSPRKYPAVISAVQTSTLSFIVGGPLIEIRTSAGDSVRKGDLIMRIDPRDFQHDVDSAQAKVDAAQAQLDLMKAGARAEDIEILEAKIESARAQQNYAQGEYQRAVPLLSKKAITSSELDLMKSNLRTADAQIRSLEQELIKAKAGERKEEIAVKEAEIADLKVALEVARSALDDTYLRAPFDGIVAVQNVNNFEIVHPGDPVVTIMDISKLNVNIWIPEHDILSSRHSKIKGEVTFPSLGNRLFSARLKEGEAQANPQTRAWKVVFEMERPKDVVLLPGMTAMLTLRNLENADIQPIKTILIPVAALCADSSGQFVWIVDQNLRAVKRNVQTGKLASSQKIEILNGLRPGEKIVTAGSQFVQAGDTLKEI